MATKNDIINHIIAIEKVAKSWTDEESRLAKRRLQRQNKGVLLERLKELQEEGQMPGQEKRATRYNWPNPNLLQLWLVMEELGFRPGPLSPDLRANYDEGEPRWFNLYFEPETYRSPAHRTRCYRALGTIRSRALDRGWSANFSRDESGMGYLRIIRRS